MLVSENRLVDFRIREAANEETGDDAEATVHRQLYRQFEDKACLTCGGHGQIKCPNNHCRRGRVAKYRMESIKSPDGHWSVPRRVRYYETCPACEGDAAADCWGCNQGRQGF